MKISAQEARNTAVFVINYKNEVEETTLFEHIMESAEKTTSPRGVEHKLFIDELQDEETGETKWALREWSRNGKSYSVSPIFDTYEEADDEKFQMTWDHDFMPDDQRDTMYYSTREAAKAELEDRKKYQ